jgi:hypothetical protein
MNASGSRYMLPAVPAAGLVLAQAHAEAERTPLAAMTIVDEHSFDSFYQSGDSKGSGASGGKGGGGPRL